MVYTVRLKEITESGQHLFLKTY